MSRKQKANFKGKISGSDPRYRAIAKKLRRDQATERIAQCIDQAAHARAAAALLNKAPEQMTRDQVRDIITGCRLAMEDLRTGQADEAQIGWLVNAVNLALILAEQGLGDDADMAAIKAGQDGLVRLIARQKRLGRFGLDGPGWQALSAALAVHDAQIESEDLTDRMMLCALVTLRQRIEAGQFIEVVEITPQALAANDERAFAQQRPAACHG